MRLTERQEQILQFIEAYVEKHGVPPSIREIGDQFHIYPRAAHDHLRALERKGSIKRTPHKSRSVRVSKNRLTSMTPSGQRVPIVGNIAAGMPILAVEHIQGGLVVDKDLFKGDEFFAVQVRGDSMIEDHILDGDFVLLRKQPTADQGDVVAVLIDETVTLKRFFRSDGEVELRPANQNLRPLVFQPDEVSILGKMVGLIRKT
jgi:repressor LexA